jgi:hypothetical protein
VKSQPYDSEKTWPSINHSILSGVHKIHELSHLRELSSLLLSLRNISSILLNFSSGWGAEERDWNFLWGKFHIPEMEEQCSAAHNVKLQHFCVVRSIAERWSSDSQCRSRLQLSRVRSQHPPKQWILMENR